MEGAVESVSDYIVEAVGKLRDKSLLPMLISLRQSGWESAGTHLPFLLDEAVDALLSE